MTLEHGDGKSTHLLLAQTPHLDGSRPSSSSLCNSPFPPVAQNSTLLLCTEPATLAMPAASMAATTAAMPRRQNQAGFREQSKDAGQRRQGPLGVPGPE